MPHEIQFTESAASELEALKAYDLKRVARQIEKQLVHQPTVATKKRKCLDAVSPKFQYEPPLWELRVGVFRVFYDVNEAQQKVVIRAVRRKAPEQRTEDIIQ